MTSYINAKSMKIMAIFIIVFDLVLLVVWFAGMSAILSKLQDDICFNEVFIVHFFILIHFAMGMSIASMVSDIIIEEKKHEYRILHENQLQHLKHNPKNRNLHQQQ